MRLVVQRVKSASVSVEGKVISSIGPGIMALVGIHEHDTEDDLQFCCKRLLGVKLWENDNGQPWRQGVKQKGYSVLLVSQFTLYGTIANKKYQPDYKKSMKAIPAEALYSKFLELVKSEYPQPDKIFDGVFGAMMDVALVNDGPVTLLIESTPKEPLPLQLLSNEDQNILVPTTDDNNNDSNRMIMDKDASASFGFDTAATTTPSAEPPTADSK